MMPNFGGLTNFPSSFGQKIIAQNKIIRVLKWSVVTGKIGWYIWKMFWRSEEPSKWNFLTKICQRIEPITSCSWGHVWLQLIGTPCINLSRCWYLNFTIWAKDEVDSIPRWWIVSFACFSFVHASCVIKCKKKKRWPSQYIDNFLNRRMTD